MALFVADMSLAVKSLAEQIQDILREQLVAGTLPVEQAIKANELALEFGVSKGPVREAIIRLEIEGLLESRGARGYFVPRLSEAEVEEVYELRLKMEPGAVAEAALSATDDDHRIAYDCLLRFEDGFQQSRPDVWSLNREFHLALLRPLNKPITLRNLQQLYNVSERYVVHSAGPHLSDESFLQEHRDIFAAWRDRQGKTCAEMVRRHILTVLEQLRATAVF